MIYTLTIIITFISFFAGISTDLFGLAKPEYVPTGSLSIAILTFLIGDRFEDSRREDKRQSTLDNYLSSKPSLNVITEFQDTESAMEYLASRIPFSHTILNTKISSDGINSTHGVALKYEKALKLAIKNGVTYKDIKTLLAQASKNMLHQ